jgi:dihydrofolate reductase
MRRITAGLFIALDGVVADPQDWHFPYFNDEMGAAVGDQVGTADTMLFGRTTYEGFAAAWPAREQGEGGEAEMARHFGDIRKIVVTHRDIDLTWRNSEVLQGDLIEAVIALKQEPGGDIGMSGSVSIVRQLLEANLIDELHLLVHPIAIRSGLRLFEEADTPLPLTLLRSATFETGVVHTVYGPGELLEGGYEQAREQLR